MSDSVDRVFSHALNTVNKIRTGSEKPPSSIRLKLYGLYKQSMEGDVEGIMDRPIGQDEESHRAREKWDAWAAQTGLSRTEAKRRYITTLISTMQKYASPTPDARELVAELEFVWDQVKSNVPSSNSSSPLQILGASILGLPNQAPPIYPTLGDSGSLDLGQGRGRDDTTPGKMPMRVLSPASRGIDDPELDADVTGGEEEFVDAQDSQYNPHEAAQVDSPTPLPRRERRSQRKSQMSGSRSQRLSSQRDDDDEGMVARRPSMPGRSGTGNEKWRKQITSTLEKMTAEVAALREQLESRRLFTYHRRHNIWAWMKWVLVGLAKVFLVDCVIFAFVLVWMRAKRDRRLEGAMRVLLGDAVAEVRRRAGGVRLGNIGVRLPALRKKRPGT